jgi:polysaccharide pyruvyl transferase WcaK-like protein
LVSVRIRSRRRYLPMTGMSSTSSAPSCLLLGYSGFSNTGSEVRVITIIEDLRACFGADVTITVASPAPEKTARILPTHPNVKVASFPLVFFWRILRLVSQHDIVFLVEGSTFQQNWSSTLLYYFLWGAWCARLLGKRCIAYAVDAGPLSPVNRRLTRQVCERLDLLITRTERAKQRLASAGVRRPILANTDTAFAFLLDEPRLTPAGAKTQTLGVAPIEFYQWPVRVRPFGRKDECFRWPYYYTWNDERRQKSAAVIRAFAALVTDAIETHDLDVVLIGMEELDARVCDQILAAVEPRLRSRIRTACSGVVLPHEMVPLLRSLDYLVTSRYHACVLSMAGSVPQMAVCHDDRLQSIYDELGLRADFLLDYRSGDLEARMIETFAALLERGSEMREWLAIAHVQQYLPRCRQNREDLREWAAHYASQRAPGRALLSAGVPARETMESRPHV